MRFSELKQYRDDLLAQGDSAAASNRSMESQRKVSYVVERGIGEYVDDLPSIPAHLLPDSFMDTEKREMNVITFIETQLRQKLESGRLEKLSILDVGCGRGEFLVELFDHLANKFFDGRIDLVNEHVLLAGVTIADLRDSHFRSDSKQEAPSPIEKRLDDRGIEYLLGDMRMLTSVLETGSQQKFDCIVSDVAICYVKPVRMRKEVLRQLYRALKPDGVATLSCVNWLSGPSDYPFLETDVERTDIDVWVNKEFRSRGLKVECLNRGLDLVMCKNEQPFSIDLPYTRDGDLQGIFTWANAINGVYLPVLTEAEKDEFKAAYANAFEQLFTVLNLESGYTEIVLEWTRPGVRSVLPRVFEPFVRRKAYQGLATFLERDHRSDAVDYRLVDRVIDRFFTFTD